jgi:uncharacterized protein DUF2735
MLTTRVNEGSAKIYQFPAGGRAALGGRRYGDTATAVSEFVAAPAADLADCSGSWYHAAAIQETKPGRDH